MRPILAALALLCASASATTGAKAGLRIMESRSSAPEGWVPGPRAADADAVVRLAFFLRPASDAARARAEDELLRRSDPTSPLYGKWLTNAQVHSLLAPSTAGVAAVKSMIAEAGGESVPRTPNSDVITTDLSVAEAEALLGAEFRLFTHPATGTTVLRCLTYSLPEEVAEHVALVGPTTHFPRPSTLGPKRQSGADSAPNTPDNLRALYSVGDILGGAAADNKQAVTAFLRQYYSSSDLEQFFGEYFPQGADTPIDLVGDATEGSAGVESMLDIEYMPAMGALIPTGFWGFSGRSPNAVVDEPFLTWLYTVSNTSDADVPLVFSTSYGEDETSEVPSTYADRVDTEFIKCGLRGISLLFASGDSGAAADSGTCPGSAFMPMWPAGSPYVTSVGGTTGAAMPETAWPYSSGGFSNYFSQPSWQQEAVATYLATAGDTLPAASYFNASGRGFPDISAQATGYPVVVKGVSTPVAGTSCASPCSGGVFGLLNDARLAANKTSLGFLNPMLYANADALNDCTSGVQSACDGVDGFTAIDGWDPVTGLGSPNYEALLDVVMALP